MEPTDQAPTTPSPTKRRRRRLIVAFVLVLVLTVVWWYWPRGDARFVGSFRSSTTGGKWSFASNGLLRIQQPARVDVMPWQFDGASLVLGSPVETPGFWIKDRSVDLFETMTGTLLCFGTGQEKYRVTFKSPNDIELDAGVEKHVLIRE